MGETDIEFPTLRILAFGEFPGDLGDVLKKYYIYIYFEA